MKKPIRPDRKGDDHPWAASTRDRDLHHRGGSPPLGGRFPDEMRCHCGKGRFSHDAADDAWTLDYSARRYRNRGHRPDATGAAMGFASPLPGEHRAVDHRGRGPIGYVRSDARILEDVNDRLTEDRWLDASGIRVTVAGGEVTLAGRVDAKGAKRRAEDLADAVPGVTHVQNNLRVDAAFFAAGGERA